MKSKVIDRFISWLLAFILVISAMSSVSLTYSNAQLDLEVKVTYNASLRVYEISFPIDIWPEKVIMSWHDPDGQARSLESFTYDSMSKTVRLTTALEKDHIYDINIQAFAREDDPMPFASGFFYYLPGITFTGESFSVMAESNSIIDRERFAENQSIVSGRNPKIKLTWNVPTIYANATLGSVSITEILGGNTLGNMFGTEIDEVRFHIDMNVGRGSTNRYPCGVIIDSSHNFGWIGEGTSPLDMDYSPVTAGSGKYKFSIVLDREKNNIQPGTEYEDVRIRIAFKRAADPDEMLTPSILKTGGSHFQVQNEDIRKLGIQFDRSTSIYTPIEFSIKKVDETMIMVEFNEIRNGNYPELFYQIQHETDPNKIYHEMGMWPRIKWIDPYAEKIREIIPYRAGDYIAVVFFPNKDSNRPLGASLSLRSNFLDEIEMEAPPPLPKSIEVSAVETGEKEITIIDTGGAQETDKILISDLDMSFEAPLAWKQLRNSGEWEAFKNGDYGNYGDDIEYTYHVLVSAYRPDAEVEDGETREIGGKKLEVYMPVKQKRVLVIGKKQLAWDPRNPDRLVVDMDPAREGFQPIPGDKLFWDYTADSGIPFENDADINEDSVAGDYPGFLVPNTIYYMQVFTSRYKDNESINQDKWADGISDSLRIRLSYLSPVYSFTTYPHVRKAVPVPIIERVFDITQEVDGQLEIMGIQAELDHLFTKTDWQRYTDKLTGLRLEYEFLISKSPSFEASETDTVYKEHTSYYVDTVPVIIMITTTDTDIIRPNTVYYVKVRANLYDDPGGSAIEWSDFSPIKAFTTPKIEPKDIDDTGRKPSAPADFAIAKDENGEERVTDARVDLTWRHREEDVLYELICTTDGDTEDFINDDYNRLFIDIYNKIADPDANAVIIDPDDPDGILQGYGFSIDENNQIIMPIGEGFLKPNRIYYFSLRAVRKDGEGEPSDWVTLPVTTRMVKAPEYFEAVRDLEVGFNVECGILGTDADSMEVYMKKHGQRDSAYKKLLRSQYTVVKDGTRYYYRIYNLESDTMYNFRLYNRTGKLWYVYDRYGGFWDDDPGEPIPAKTRDTFSEIEVRWVGEDLYRYFLEIRSEHETVYRELSSQTHYWYDTPEGLRIDLYKEKTSAFVREKAVNKYVYYARITRRPVTDAMGLVSHMPLDTNTLYYIRLWAENIAADQEGESLRVGPVSIRTDFSQEDYDKDRRKDDLQDIYNMEADQLLRKMYWLVDSRSPVKLRALIKGDMVSGLLQASPGMTVTIDFSGELANAESYDILVPQKVLETIESNDSRLNLKLSGAELTLSRGSVDINDLKRQALGSGAKEAMLCLRVQRLAKSDEALPDKAKLISMVYDLSVYAVGSRHTYSEMAAMIHDILENPDASGPFKYGIFDREMSRVLKQLEQYSYRSHTELLDLIGSVIKSIETELSWYLKDILDGGSELKAGIFVIKAIHAFPGRIGIKIEYMPTAGIIVPYVNYHASKGWDEVRGARGYVLQYVLFRADAPGEYAVLAGPSVSVSPGSSYEGIIDVLGRKYDLTKVFGNTTIYPGNPITGQQAVMLYAVLTGRESELNGLTPNQKVFVLGIGEIIGVRELTGYMENQGSVSLAVLLYCEKTGIPPSMLWPSRTFVISNADQINKRLYNYVVLGIDLGLASLDNNRFDAAGRSTIGQVLDMVAKVLEKAGEI
ncbi:MAG: hypothetical protein GX027_09935 [Clostridiaceae bacterium]|nr:hypothetical protein [Clostridiaceae bacterium]